MLLILDLLKQQIRLASTRLQLHIFRRHIHPKYIDDTGAPQTSKGTLNILLKVLSFEETATKYHIS